MAYGRFGKNAHWRIQEVANRAKVSQWLGQKPFWPLPFKADTVLKIAFGRAKPYHFHQFAGSGPALANWLDPPVKTHGNVLSSNNQLYVLRTH